MRLSIYRIVDGTTAGGSCGGKRARSLYRRMISPCAVGTSTQAGLASEATDSYICPRLYVQGTPMTKSAIPRKTPSRGKIATQSAGIQNASQGPPTIVQDVAWTLKGGVRGSLTALSKASGMTLDALRVAKRPPGTKGARQLSPPRARMLALLLAAHRKGTLAELLNEATDIETEWRNRYPGALAG